MAGMLMGQFAFYAQATFLSSLLHIMTTSLDDSNLAPTSPTEDFPPLLGSSKTSSVMDQVASQKEADRITNLPGLSYDPGFDQFSGYITVGNKNQRKLFYWYVESQNKPETDPVVFWTNGGPGCSGLLGFGTEHGPFHISNIGDLSPNPYSWNSLANMLYIEQPAGVGFSYSENSDDYTTGDTMVATDAYDFIYQFFERFPERRSNPFYAASESYGGHYIPQCKSRTHMASCGEV